MCVRPSPQPGLIPAYEGDDADTFQTATVAAHAWTHRVIVNGGFWCYAASLAQALAIAGGDADCVEPLARPIPLR